jgi:hypothetical protein
LGFSVALIHWRKKRRKKLIETLRETGKPPTDVPTCTRCGIQLESGIFELKCPRCGYSLPAAPRRGPLRSRRIRIALAFIGLAALVFAAYWCWLLDEGERTHPGELIAIAAISLLGAGFSLFVLEGYTTWRRRRRVVRRRGPAEDESDKPSETAGDE